MRLGGDEMKNDKELDKELVKKYGKAYYTQMVNRMQKVKEESKKRD